MLMQQFSNKENFLDVSSDKKENLILKILGDNYCIAILKAIKEIPKSSIELCHETKIPVSTVYRRIQTLYDLGLLLVSGTITDDGKRVFLYKSKIKSIDAKFNGQLEVKIIFK